MKIVNLLQGSPEWHAHRAQHFNASDAPAMMGCSLYKTRDELIAELSTGVTPEVGAAQQRIFDAGHQFEALARPLAEGIIGEELYPVVGADEKYSASFDGLTMLEDAAFEHKSLNAALREAMTEGCTGTDLPLQYQVQMEQQAMVSGCDRILFMASKWETDRNTGEMSLIEERHCWYTPNLELRAQIVAGWNQLECEVAAYIVPASEPVKVVAEEVTTLPVVFGHVFGELDIKHNLPAFEVAWGEFLANVLIRDPETDLDFVTLEQQVKSMEAAEAQLKAAEDTALSQTEVLSKFITLKRELVKLVAAQRNASKKQLTEKKESIRQAQVQRGQKAFAEHIAALNARLGKPYMPPVPTDFPGAVKGKRTVDTLRGAVNDELARAKIAANEVADRIHINLTTLRELASKHAFLFADTAQIVLKATDDCTTLVKARIAEHQAAEDRRLEAEREKIRAEEAERANRIAREETALLESIWANARRIEADQVPYIRKAMAQFESGAGQFENDPRSRVREAVAGARAELKGKLAAAEQRQAHEAKAAAARDNALRAELDAQAELADARKADALPEPLLNDLSAAATHVRNVTIASLDADQAISTAKNATPVGDIGEVATVTIGDINTLLAPVCKTDAAGLAELGFNPRPDIKTAKRYPASDVPKILAAMVKHLQDLMVAA